MLNIEDAWLIDDEPPSQLTQCCVFGIINAELIRMQKKKILYLDILRIIASLAVIAIHVAAQNWNSYTVDTFEWGAFNFFNSMSRWAVPVFCMISGALFLDCDRNVKIKKLYSKNILRMVISFTVWSVFYLFLIYDVKTLSITEIIKTVCTGNYHMWYIFLIIGFYALVPVLRKISATKESSLYFIIISIIVTFIIPAITLLPKLGWTSAIISKAFLNLTLGYTPYFFMGHYIVKYDIKKKFKNLIYLLGIMSAVLIPAGTLVVSQLKGKFYGEFYSYDSLTVLFQSLFVFVLVKDIFEGKSFSKGTEKVISSLSKDTFGVYMVHVFSIIFIERMFRFESVTINPYIAIPVIVIGSYIISEIISFILNRIPIVNKYIV